MAPPIVFQRPPQRIAIGQPLCDLDQKQSRGAVAGCENTLCNRFSEVSLLCLSPNGARSRSITVMLTYCVLSQCDLHRKRADEKVNTNKLTCHKRAPVRCLANTELEYFTSIVCDRVGGGSRECPTLPSGCARPEVIETPSGDIQPCMVCIKLPFFPPHATPSVPRSCDQ